MEGESERRLKGSSGTAIMVLLNDYAKMKVSDMEQINKNN